MYIDNHCHLFKEYYKDIDTYILECKENDIKKIIVSGCDKRTNLEVLELVSKYDIVYGSIGFHPNELDNVSEEDIKWLEDNISNDKIVAIGEIGLDYHYDKNVSDKQKYYFKKQLDLALKHDKPAIIHSRDAIEDTYNILCSYKIRGVLHSYSGSLEMARLFINLGYFIGISGIITFKNAHNIKRVVDGIDLNKLLVETDAPYLTPTPYRGEVNYSKYIPLIIDEIAVIKGMGADYVAEVTTDNSMSLFDF